MGSFRNWVNVLPMGRTSAFYELVTFIWGFSSSITLALFVSDSYLIIAFDWIGEENGCEIETKDVCCLFKFSFTNMLENDRFYLYCASFF